MDMSTDSLRKAAPNWSLAGDKQLLGVLQQIHQSIMTKCQEANAKLDAMVDALDNASIDLQNVNNKFMALSNSKFVESRVYDDDVDIKTEDNLEKQTAHQITQESDIDKIKRSLHKLELMHEPVHILDSDSSDDDEETSIILKPKDMYSSRPLPYIIGSDAWKKNWHAGLIQSDSDSEGSSHTGSLPAEEYSDSEEDVVERADTISSSGVSEVVPQTQAQTHTAAQVAAQIASRLAAQLPPPPPVENLPPEPTTSKVYRIDKPAPATIFSNEPPPLPESESYSESSDDDIFAELHKESHRNSYSTDRNRSDIVDELFADLKSDIGNIVNEPSKDRGESPLFNDARIANKEKSTNKQTYEADTNIKKPIGGISLFGTNEGAESIGAAILKRQQRQSSDSDATDEQTQPIKENKNIINELFTKPIKKKEMVKKIDKDITTRESGSKIIKDNKPKDKIDLFNDNLFDDIDDIFTTNVVTKPKKDQKSIFDDDDLFSDVVKDKPNDKKDTKSIFDGDDDLFSDNDVKTAKDNESNENLGTFINKDKKENFTDNSKDTKSIFGSDDDLFVDNYVKITPKLTDTSTNNQLKDESEKNNTITKELKDTKETKSIFDSDDNLFIENVIKVSESKITNTSKNKQIKNENKKAKSVFDDNSDDDLFLDVKTNTSESKLLKDQINKNVMSITSDDKRNIFPTKTHDPKESYINEEKSTITSKNAVEKINKDTIITTEDNKRTVNKNNKFLTNTLKANQLQSPNLIEDNEIDDLFSPNTPQVVETRTNSKIHEESKIINQNIDEIKNIIDDSNSESLERSFENDFDDESKGIEQTTVINTNKGTKTEIIVGEDFDTFNNVIQETNSKTETIREEDTKIPESTPSYDIKESNRVLFDDIQKEPLFSEPVVTESKEPDIFSDIFNDLPPDFEKPIESKKSKNVNALFDDDSDDEALFFKKNDVISDDKPDLITNSGRFRIFHDEPPDIDVDFSQKTIKSVSEKPLDDNFDDLPKIDSVDTKYTEVSRSSKNLDTLEQVIQQSVTSDVVSKTDTNNTINITELLEKVDKESEINISKLLEDQYSFSDESNTLTSESTDNVPNTTKRDSEQHKTEKTQEETREDNKKPIGKLKTINLNINVNTLLPGASPKKTKNENELSKSGLSAPETKKSVSIDDTDSAILDNKLSKERAKIQVKRRPSTRRARLEAVRKSYVNQSDGSSFDEPKSKSEVDSIIVTKEDISRVKHDEEGNSSIPEDTKSTHSKDIHTKLDHNFKKSTNVKTESVKKVVYILNDDDIFSDSSQNTKKDLSTDKKKGYLFDDLSDNELFGKKKFKEAKESLFDSDSEGELFSKSKRVSKKKENDVKSSLFGDESDDDLFSSKPTKVTDEKQRSKPNPSTSKPTEPVFEDPLSLLGDYDS